MEAENLTGKRFKNLTVIAYSHKDPYGSLMWRCRCDCGKETIVRSTSLRKGQIESCGCRSKSRKHGLHRHKLYNVWQGLKTRCNNPNSNRFKYYGGKGIKVCEEWLEFNNFFNWAVTHGYKEGLTLDRLDSEKGYSLDNCQWVDYKHQNSHKSNQKRILYGGREFTLKEATRIAQVPLTTIYRRLRRGMSHKDIIELPPQTKNGRTAS